MASTVQPGKHGMQVEQTQHQLDGTIEFQDVYFSYPIRPEVKVQYIYCDIHVCQKI